jgi:WD40 repeat protein
MNSVRTRLKLAVSIFAILVLWLHPQAAYSDADLTCGETPFSLDNPLLLDATVTLSRYSENAWASLLSLAWSPDAQRLAVDYREIVENTFPAQLLIGIWDVPSQTLLALLDAELNEGISSGYISNLSWSPDGRYLAASNYERLRIWDMQAEGFAEIFDSRVDIAVQKLEWSRDSESLFIATLSPYYVSRNPVYPYGDMLRIWSSETNILSEGLLWVDTHLMVAALDEGLVTAVVNDNLLHVYEEDIETPLLRLTEPGRYLMDLRAYADNIRLVTFEPRGDTLDDIVQVWDVIEQEMLLEITGIFSSVAYLSPGGRYLQLNNLLGAAGVEIWDITAESIVVRLQETTNFARRVLWSNNERCLAAPILGAESNIFLDIEQDVMMIEIGNDGLGPIIAGSAGISQIAWSPDSERLAISRTNGIVEIRG